jgi:hypothetical protein
MLIDTANLRYLDPEDIRVFRTDDGRLRVTVKDELSVLAPRFVRANPLTDPDRYLSIRESGTGATEVGMLRNWQRLGRDARALVEADLKQRYLYPVVQRIVSVREYGGTFVCVLRTDRGEREATFRDLRSNVVYVNQGRILLTDAEGVRYDVPDVRALDPASRALLSQVL